MLISFEQRTQRQKCSGHCSGHVQVAARSSQDGNLHQHQQSKVRQIRHHSMGSPTKVRARSPDLRFGGVVRVAAAARRLGPATVPSPQGRAMGGQVAANLKPPLAARAEAVTVAAARPPLPLNLSEGIMIGKDPEAADAAGLMPDHRKVPSTQSRAVMPHTALSEARPGCPSAH